MATITVPCTKGSKLAKILREALIGTGPKGTQVKVIEKPGPRIMSGISQNNPFKRKSCGRQECPYLMQWESCNEQCWKEGIIYAANCNRCYEEQIDQVETFRYAWLYFVVIVLVNYQLLFENV